MQNLLVLDLAYPFWANLVQKSKLPVQTEILDRNQFEYAEFNGGVNFFHFWREIPFLGKVGQKKQNCQFKLKFGTETLSHIQNSMVMFTFPVLNRKYPF